MTTYNGRSANYIPGKEVPNKEPPVSKFVVEKLYQVHRERLMKVTPTIDSHIHIPDFMKNQSWKKNVMLQQQKSITQHNQEIYRRIAKLEHEESPITKDSRMHVKRIESKAKYIKKLKHDGRVRRIVKIQKENEYFMKRIERVQPMYSLKDTKEWYKHHQNFKAGRRVDPTAGHIMSTVKKGLLPTSLPPLSHTDSVSRSLNTSDPNKYVPYNSIVSSQKSINSNTILTGTTGIVKGRKTNSAPIRTDSHSIAESGITLEEEYDEDFNDHEELEQAAVQKRRTPKLIVESYDSADIDNLSGIVSINKDGSVDDSLEEEDLVLISSRPFPVMGDTVKNFEHKNCLVMVYTSKQYDENLYFKVMSAGISNQLLHERSLSIDSAYEIINYANETSQIIHSSDQEDLQILSSLLIDMFKAADVDNSGFLTFDQFQDLMEKVDLGISSQELRFVISEADENDNGLVEYDEFVPLAVDMIQSFRARNKAKTLNSQQDVMVDDQILKTISAKEMEELAGTCLQKIAELDVKGYGVVRVQDLKKTLSSVGVALKENEISMLCQMLPRDQFGRCKYNSPEGAFAQELKKVRFMTMKNTIIESKGSGLQKYLLDLCKDTEFKQAEGITREKFVPTGIIACRPLINILSTSPRLTLSRLQVAVLMSEASVLEGMINYFQFIPVVAKAIEFMFEPKSLRQRAELIEKTDLSPEALLKGMSSEMFEQRLLTLFKSYDIDHSGGLDQNEFIACLESLELQLTYGEMVALMAAADTKHHGYLRFDEFVSFFTRNLLHLEREKHIRLLQASMQKDHKSVVKEGGKMADLRESFVAKLVDIFKLSDPDNTGFIDYDDFEDILKNFLGKSSSKFKQEVMLSELHISDDRKVCYIDSVETCGDLLQVFTAKQIAEEEEKKREEWAERKATSLTEAAAEDINHIVKFLRQHIRYVNESGSENLYKYRAIQSIIKDPHSGLSRVEANYVISKLFSQKTGKKSKNNSPTKPGSPNLKSFSNDFVARSTCKTNFNTHELSEAVFEARKLSLMRGILEEVDSDSLQSLILQKLEAGLMEFTNNESGTEKSSLNFLPVASCFKVLQEAKELRLNRAQIMFIISWADCFDKDGASLDIRKFAEHAANIVEQISIPEVMDTRAEVVYHGKIDGKRVMNGLKEKDLYRYLEYQFSNRASNGEISVDELKTVLRSAPRINLSEREAVTIVSSIDTAGSKVNCKEVLSTLVNSVFTLCRERMINRRVSLVVTSQLLMQNGGIETKQSMRLQTNSIKTLKDVAERLLNFAKIVREDQNIFVRFPKDELHQGSSSNLLYDDAVNMSEVSVLFRGAMMIPLVKLVSNNFGSSGNDVGMMRSSSGIDLSAANRILSTASRELLRASTVSGSTKVSSSPISPAKRGMSLSRSNSRVVPFSVPAEKISGKIAGFIRIISTEDSAGNVTLTASIISVDLDYQVSNKLEVKLPSIGLVDKEVAVQIASNVAEKMYLELSSFNQMTLKLYQEETVED